MLKKILPFLIAIVMLTLSAISASASESNTTNFYYEATAKGTLLSQGDTVKVTAFLTGYENFSNSTLCKDRITALRAVWSVNSQDYTMSDAKITDASLASGALTMGDPKNGSFGLSWIGDDYIGQPAVSFSSAVPDVIASAKGALVSFTLTAVRSIVYSPEQITCTVKEIKKGSFSSVTNSSSDQIASFNQSSVQNYNNQSTILYGDLDASGAINILDLLYCKEYVTGIATFGNNFNMDHAADCNGDNTVNALDLIRVKNALIHGIADR